MTTQIRATGRSGRWRDGGARWLVAVLLASCAASRQAPAPAAPELGAPAYVVLGAGGQVLVRTVTDAAQCPALRADGLVLAMQARVPAQTAPRRPHQAKAAAFPLQVCEAAVPPGAVAVRLGETSLPLPKPRIDRIVVVGDTGCRIKVAEHAFQDCKDPARWPFGRIAAAAALETPDLVIHVGDYHYRENACPPAEVCANSVWGFGWDAWQADFFDPARPLLRAAPWIVARGNHEECARAGQGWFRLLDPAPYSAGRSCDDPHDDAAADFSEPYAVPLGGDWQVIVFDSALASRPPDPADPADARRLERYRDNLRAVDALAAVPGRHSLFVSHHPVLGFTVSGAGVHFGNDALVEAMKSGHGTRYFPPGVEAGLHGHVHSFQAIDFPSGHPPAIVAGHGGDQLDTALEGRPLEDAYAYVDGVRIGDVATSHSFGYLVLERAADGWLLHARQPDGAALTDCTLRAMRLACDGRVPTTHPRHAGIAGGG